MVSVQRDWNVTCESGSQQELWDGLQGSSQSGCALGCDALGSDVGVVQWEGAAEKDPDVPVSQGGSPASADVEKGAVGLWCVLAEFPLWGRAASVLPRKQELTLGTSCS